MSSADSAKSPPFAAVPSEAASPATERTALLGLLLALLTGLRLWYGSALGLAHDEAYYWQWSRHPDLSYYDQGPGIALLIRLGTLLLGPTHLGIRLVVILMAAGTTYLAFLTARRWLGERVALWTAGLLTVSPLLSAGSILATYDGPQVFFWTLALYLLTRTVQENRVAGWYAVAVVVGLGALCKITMLLIAPCVLLFLLLSPAYRQWLATPHPYLAFGIALALYSPVVIWNAQHGWMGFLHSATLSNRTRDAAPLRWFGDFLGGQAIALSPFLFLAELYALWRLAKNVRDDGGRFVLAFGAPVLVVCLLMSLRSKQEINWPAPTHIGGLMAVALYFDGVWRSKRPVGRAGIALTLLVALVVTLIAFFPGLLPAVGLQVSAEAAQKLNETYGWPQIAVRVQAARETLAREGKPVFVFGVNYRVNSVMAYYLPGKPETKGMYLNSRRDQYWVWTDHRALVGQNAVFYLDDENEDAVALARRYFASVETLEPVIIRRPGFTGPAKLWYLYLCRDFKGYDPLRHVAGY